MAKPGKKQFKNSPASEFSVPGTIYGELDRLPLGWAIARLGDVTVPKVEQAEPEGNEFRYIDIGSVDNRAKRITDAKILPVAKAPSRARQLVKSGDVLVSMTRPNLNAVALVPTHLDGATASTGFDVLRGVGILPAWLLLVVRSRQFVNAMSGLVQGALYPAVRPSDVRGFEFPLPPLAEQERIVPRLNELTRRLENARRVMQEVPALLTRTRQSFLAAAFHGELSAQWRKSNNSAPDSGTSLVRALEDAHEDAGGHKRGNAAQATEGVHDLDDQDFPPSWGLTDLRHICEPGRPVTYGILMPGPNQTAGVPYVRVADFPNDAVQLDTVRRTTTEMDASFARSRLRRGDLLLSIRGTVGRVAVGPPELDGANITQDSVRLSVHEAINSTFIAWMLRAPNTQRRMQLAMKGVAVRGINVGDVRALQFPIPPLAEQKEIVRLLERAFARLDAVAAAHKEAVADLDRLDHALLAKAFLGELVPQDPSGEPAEELLSRLRAAKELTSLPTEDRPSKKKPPSHAPVKKTKTEPPSFTQAKLPESQLTDFKLRSFKVEGRYGSLHDFSLELRDDVPSSLAPICMVGLNGSGKSNALEALSEIFTYLELLHLPWKKLRKKRVSSLLFDLRYAAKLKGQPFKEFRVTKSTKEGAQYFEIKKDGEALEITDPVEQLASLPRRVVGYSSGLNETLSIPYFKTKALYAREVREAAIKKPADLVADTRTLFMDYESNSAILLTNFLFARPAKLKTFDRFLRVVEIESFKLRFNFKPPGLSQKVKLTDQLKDHLNKIAKCAGSSFDATGGEQCFEFGKASDYRASFGKAFPNGGGEFFMALYRLSLLNALCLTGNQRDLYEKRDPRAGIVERPPTVPSFDRIFSIDDLQLRLSAPDVVVPYAALSDGEHQFVQIFGTIMLFNEPGTLFLLDEPESHFNPEWRSKFVTILDEVGAVQHQELALSTHSPFIVSGCRGKYVFKFERDKADVTCVPVGFETYGSSFDYLLGKLFNMDALVATQALDAMKEVVDNGDLAALEDAVGEFGESFEKRFLFQRIAEKKAAKRKRRKGGVAKAKK